MSHFPPLVTLPLWLFFSCHSSSVTVHLWHSSRHSLVLFSSHRWHIHSSDTHIKHFLRLCCFLSVLTSSTSYASVVSSLSSHQAPLYASVAPLLLLFSSCLLLYLCELFPLLLSRVVYVLTTFSSPLVFVSIHSHSPLSQLLIWLFLLFPLVSCSQSSHTSHCVSSFLSSCVCVFLHTLSSKSTSHLTFPLVSCSHSSTTSLLSSILSSHVLSHYLISDAINTHSFLESNFLLTHTYPFIFVCHHLYTYPYSSALCPLYHLPLSPLIFLFYLCMSYILPFLTSSFHRDSL